MSSAASTPPTGAVYSLGRGHDRADPRAIVARGLARTYQNKRLFGSLTVLENVVVPPCAPRPAPGWATSSACPPAASPPRQKPTNAWNLSASPTRQSAPTAWPTASRTAWRWRPGPRSHAAAARRARRRPQPARTHRNAPPDRAHSCPRHRLGLVEHDMRVVMDSARGSWCWTTARSSPPEPRPRLPETSRHRAYFGIPIDD